MTAQYTAPGGATAATTTGATLERPGTRGTASRGGSGARRSFGSRLLRGREDAPRWERPALIALLVVTAGLYLWDLGASGWANSFYSAAVQAGSTSWEAFFFGSSDAGNSITVDKPPASLWVMALSVRIFGLSSWSMLVPQALIGVGTTLLLNRTVRRHASAGAALIAAAALAITPVAALMFRFNNPDALLVLLMTGAAYAVVRAVENGRTRWMLLAGALIGLGFLTKQLQVFLVVPTLALAYLVAGPVKLGRRILQLLASGVAILVAAGWWVAIVELWPASSRPYIGGSTDNSFLGLTLGYNGLGRLTGKEAGSVGGGGSATTAGNWGATGITRLFTSEFGGQWSWLLPAALVMGAVAFVLLRRRPRVDGERASLIIWGGWVLVTGLTFSFMSGIFHQYYTVALAPGVAALVGISVSVLWRERSRMLALAGLAVATAGTAVWAFVLLSRSSSFVPWLSWVVLVGGLIAALGLVATVAVPSLTKGVAALALVTSLAGPLAYTIDTVKTAHTGSIVTAGPSTGSGFGGMGGTGAQRFGGGRPTGAAGGTPPTGFAQGGFGGAAGQGTAGQGTGTQGTAGQGTGTQGTGTRTGGFGGGGMGGLLDATTPSAKVVKLLQTDASSYRWVAATIGSNNAAGYQLATQDSVMPIGGFNGTDASPTLAQFKTWVSEGKIHYFITGRTGGSSSSASAITSWVTANYTETTVGGVTLYDLTSSSS